MNYTSEFCKENDVYNSYEELSQEDYEILNINCKPTEIHSY